MKTPFRDLAIGILAIVVAAVVVAFAEVPSRVSVLEAQFVGIDKKLDAIIFRMDSK